MREIMKTNIYDVSDTIIIVGSCLKYMQPEGFKKLKVISDNIYELCLEETHINMAITLYTIALHTRWIEENDEYREYWH